MSGSLHWDTYSANWPHAQRSEFVRCAQLNWHLQRWDCGVANSNLKILLLHGTGASGHSWAGLAPLLAQRAAVLSLDLPGHGFTGTTSASNMSLPGMAQLLDQLTGQLNWQPTHIIGHSAGAAIAIQMVMNHQQDQAIKVIAINGALIPFGPYALPFMAPLSKTLAQFSLIPKLFSWQARSPAVVERLLSQTGSKPPAQSLTCYQILMRHSAHAQGALQMMAQWDLKTFASNLPLMKNPLQLLVCSNDLTVNPMVASKAHGLVKHSTLSYLPSLGHLGHEEAPERVSALIEF